MTPPEQAMAARLTALVAAAERLILAEDGSHEKCDAIDALYLNFNYREIRADLAHVETLTQQVAELRHELGPEILARMAAEQQRDAALAALTEAADRLHALDSVEIAVGDGLAIIQSVEDALRAALAASAPQKGEQ